MRTIHIYTDREGTGIYWRVDGEKKKGAQYMRALSRQNLARVWRFITERGIEVLPMLGAVGWYAGVPRGATIPEGGKRWKRHENWQ